MRIAHYLLLGSHKGIQSTETKVTSEFFWPDVESDVRLFCQSCDICQRTLQKGKVSKFSLERMSLIDDHFSELPLTWWDHCF